MKTKKAKKENVQVLELRNQLARALADYDNLAKRTANEKEGIVKIANLKILIRLIPVLDMLNSAQAHLNDSGLAITIKEFEDVFKDEGIEKIEPKKGDTFSEELHEAVETQEGGEKGKISELKLVGYRYLDGPVIRHAKVKVFA